MLTAKDAEIDALRAKVRLASSAAPAHQAVGTPHPPGAAATLGAMPTRDSAVPPEASTAGKDLDLAPKALFRLSSEQSVFTEEEVCCSIQLR